LLGVNEAITNINGIMNSINTTVWGRLRELEKVARHVCKSPLYPSFRI
jgi:hypothetical protein